MPNIPGRLPEVSHFQASLLLGDEAEQELVIRALGNFDAIADTPGKSLLVQRDGVLIAEFEGSLCSKCEIWWHSMPQAS